MGKRKNTFSGRNKFSETKIEKKLEKKTNEKMKKLRVNSQRAISVSQFQAHTPFGKKDTEQILLIESRLGVLSAINYTFPFTGQSRPVVPSYKSANKEEVVELTDEDLLPKSREIEQIETLKTFENESNLSDEIREQDWKRNPLRKTTTSDLLDCSQLENILILRPLLKVDVSITFHKCPVLLEGLFDDVPDRQTSMVFVSSSTQLIKLNFGAKTPLSQINPHLTNICHFLQARGYWANAIDPKTGKAVYGQKVDVLPTSKATVPDFDVSETDNQTRLKFKKNSGIIPGVVVTNAPHNNTLMQDLKLLNELKAGLESYYMIGIEKGFLTECGQILDYESAALERHAIFDRQFKFS